MLCLILSGCLTPKKETEFVIVHPGQPITILKNVKVEGQEMQSKAISEQNIGGWVTMPPDHWKVIDEILEQYRKEHPRE